MSLVESRNDLQHILNESEGVCDRVRLKMNKNDVLGVKKDQMAL